MYLEIQTSSLYITNVYHDADIKEEQTKGPITRARAKRMKEDMNNLVLQVEQEVESKHTQGN